MWGRSLFYIDKISFAGSVKNIVEINNIKIGSICVSEIFLYFYLV